METQINAPGILNISIINEIFKYIDDDFKLLIYNEGSTDEDRLKVLSIEIIFKSGLEDYFRDLLLKKFKGSLCNEACKRGYLSTLEWALKNGCPWTYETWGTAAKHGHLNCLKWAHENRYPLNIYICNIAAANGHLNCLIWSHEHGFPWNSRTCAAAASSNNLKCLIYAKEWGCPWDSNTCSAAASAGNLQILQWARKNGCPWDSNTCSSAAKRGHLDCLIWAHDNGCPLNQDSVDCAAEGLHLNILEWFRDNDYDDWGEYLCNCAAEADRLDILQWAHANDYEWSDDAPKAAASKGHLDCFKYLLQNGCNWWFEDGSKAFGSLLECFKWTHANNVNMYEDQEPGIAASSAAELGDLDCLIWLHDNDFEMDEETCESAASEGYLHILQWAIANGCPWNKKKCLYLAKREQNDEMINFIESFEN